MSLKFLHKVLNESLKNGVRETYEEQIIEGPRGITIKMFKKDASGVERILIVGKDDSYKMKIQHGEKKNEKDLTLKEMLSELKNNKALKFAVEFSKTQKGGKLFGGRSKSKQSSKKTSKRSSKRSSKRTSKRNSKK